MDFNKFMGEKKNQPQNLQSYPRPTEEYPSQPRIGVPSNPPLVHSEQDSKIQKILVEHSRLILDKNIDQIRILKKLINCESISYELNDLMRGDTKLIESQIAELEKEKNNHKLLPKMKSLLGELQEIKNIIGREDQVLRNIDYKLEEIKNPKRVFYNYAHIIYIYIYIDI